MGDERSKHIEPVFPKLQNRPEQQRLLADGLPIRSHDSSFYISAGV